MNEQKVDPEGERLLSLEEWITEIPPATLGLSPKVAIVGAKLDAVAEALTLPAVRVGDKPLYPSLAAKAAALTSRLLRARVVHVGNREVALATAGLYLRRNGFSLVVPTEMKGDLNQLADQVARGQASETVLANFITPYIVRSGEDLPDEGPDTLLLYIAISERLGPTDKRKSLYDRIDGTAVAAAAGVADPVDLATTCPGLVFREPAADWQARRGLLVRGDRDVLGPKRAHCAAGMIVVGGDDGEVEIGLELAMLGHRGPVLWLVPPGCEVPRLVLGYSETHGNVTIRDYGGVDEMRGLVVDFVETAMPRMLSLARHRRDAALVSTPLQFRLRLGLMKLDALQFQTLLARTGFTPAYLIDLLAEPSEYTRADLGDLRLLANELGEPFEDHVSRPPPRPLSFRQESAWLKAVVQRGLNAAQALELRDQGRSLVALAQGRASLSEPADWVALLNTAVSSVA